MENDLISRSALLEEISKCTIRPNDLYEMGIMSGVDAIKKTVETASAVDAVPVESLGKIGKLFLPYKGCPRGHVGRMGGPATLEEEALQWGVITDADGGRWVPVVEDVLHELIEKAKTVDAGEVVRCGECVHRVYKEIEDCTIGGCKLIGVALLCDFYCAEGKRRYDDGK